MPDFKMVPDGDPSAWMEGVTPMDMARGIEHEGARALLDLPGAATRAQVRRELRPLFTILPELTGAEKDAVDDAALTLERGTTRTADERSITKTLNGKSPTERAQILAAYQARTGRTLESTVGPELEGRPLLRYGLLDQSNMLSAAQFEDVARLMADMELGRTAVDLDSFHTDTREERAAVRGDLANLLQTESGRALVADVARRDRSQKTQLIGGENHDAQMVDIDGRPRVNYRAGENVPITDMALRSDSVLYHELVHADDLLHHRLDHRPVTKGHPLDLKHPTRRCEYHATGLGEHYFARFSENRYIEERQRIGRRDTGARTKGIPDVELRERTSYHEPLKHYAD